MEAYWKKRPISSRESGAVLMEDMNAMFKKRC